MSSSKLAKEAIDRIMKLKSYTVSVHVEEGWLPHGIVPFDIKIKGTLMTATIPALSRAEAKERLQAFANGTDDDEDYY